MHPPTNQRTVLLVRGFPLRHGEGRVAHELGVLDWWTLGKVGSVEKVSFHTNDHVWTFLRKHKGKKFSHGAKQLWHTLDRPKEEILLLKRVSLAIKALRTPAVEKGILTQWCRDGHRWRLERGRVWFKRLRTEERVHWRTDPGMG